VWKKSKRGNIMEAITCRFVKKITVYAHRSTVKRTDQEKGGNYG
jgi:hypothetical protein